MNEELTYDSILSTMEEEYEKLAGMPIAECSDIDIRMKVLAGELYTLHCRIAKLKENMFPDTACGEGLELHAYERKLYRKSAAVATGTIDFMVDEPAEFDIIIPARTACAVTADEKCQYLTTADAVLKTGETSVSVPAKAGAEGKNGNCAAGAITLLITPPVGINRVNNPLPFTGGCDAESDDSLRQRLLRNLSVVPNGTNCSFLEDIALSFEEIAKAKAIPIARGPGTADVYITFKDGKYNSVVITKMTNEYRSKVQIGMDVEIFVAQQSAISLEADLETADGEDFELIAEECKNRLSTYIEELPIGSPVRICDLGKLLMEVQGVVNYHFTSPACDFEPPLSHEVKCTNILLKRR